MAIKVACLPDNINSKFSSLLSDCLSLTPYATFIQFFFISLYRTYMQSLIWTTWSCVKNAQRLGLRGQLQMCNTFVQLAFSCFRTKVFVFGEIPRGRGYSTKFYMGRLPRGEMYSISMLQLAFHSSLTVMIGTSQSDNGFLVSCLHILGSHTCIKLWPRLLFIPLSLSLFYNFSLGVNRNYHFPTIDKTRILSTNPKSLKQVSYVLGQLQEMSTRRLEVRW